MWGPWKARRGSAEEQGVLEWHQGAGGYLHCWPPAPLGEAVAGMAAWGRVFVCSLAGLRALQHLPASDLSPAFCPCLPPTPSLRPSSPSLLRMPLSPSRSFGTNRALSECTRDTSVLPPSFCARCRRGV